MLEVELSPEARLLAEELAEREAHTPIPVGFDRGAWIARITAALGVGITSTNWHDPQDEPISDAEYAIVLRKQYLWHGAEALRALVDDLVTTEEIPHEAAIERVLHEVDHKMRDDELQLPDPGSPRSELGVALASSVAMLGMASVFSGAVYAEGREREIRDGYHEKLIQVAALAGLLARRLRLWAERPAAETPPHDAEDTT